ncbi:MAG: PQQ-binding-like beta-propeller repeat protein [Steroidobacteraceae bacterium]
MSPSITTQPTDQKVTVGQTAAFAVVAAGTSPLTYQWQKNGTPVSAATSAAYTTPATTLGDDGSMFLVVISNSAGTVTSNTVRLTVSPKPVTGATAADVVTFKNDAARTGQALAESVLTLSNVNSTAFGLLRVLPVDGKVDAQPLYLSQLAISGGASAGTHNVVFVATEHDSVYAFDADSGAPLWHVSLLASGESLSDTHSCDQVIPEIGITSTPVIDRAAGPHGALYVVAMSMDGSSNYHQRLHALDVTTGTEMFNGPTEITASYPNAGGATTFDPGQYAERAALLLANGLIYTSWTSHCDKAPYSGWIIAFDQTTLARTSVLNVAPNSSGTGPANQGPAIWMSGDGPGADAAGNVYLLTGNGRFETSQDANGFPAQGDYGNSFVKIANTGGTLSVADYFAMSNEVSESQNDLDLGSGGEMLLPDLMDSTNTIRHLVVGAGKDGNIYVVNRDGMGKFDATANHIWQEIDGVVGGGIRSSPAYFNGTVYYGDSGGTLKAFAVSNAMLSSAPISESGNTFTYPGTSAAISANGTANGIVWAHENTSVAVLHAFDAANLAHELYNSNQAAGSRDQFGTGNKFITPVIADGKVFVGTTSAVAVFGLLP